MSRMWNSIKRIDDAAENVAKFVFTKDDAVAEAVLYKYPTYADRTVICCSTQSGCPVGCRFCGAGDSFVRSLRADEIVTQVSHCIRETGIYSSEMKRLQIMFMSMGEPLLNLKELMTAILVFKEIYPNAKLLISTSAPKIDFAEVISLSLQSPNIGLQFSIHESTDEARDRLIPFKKKMNLKEISEAGTLWHAKVGRKPFFNYCAHDGNVSEDDAQRLLALFDPKVWEATISVVCERSEGLPATNDHQRNLATGFGDVLLRLGYNVRVFDPAGQDTIGGGCGQLWFVQDWMKNNPDKARPSIGNGMPEIHVPA